MRVRRRFVGRGALLGIGATLLATVLAATLSARSAGDRPRQNAPAAGPIAAPAADAAVETSSLEAFVKTYYIHGLPIADARERFDERDVPELLALLRDPREEPYIFNIALMLGVIGDERATEALIDLVERAPAREISHPHFLALATVPTALGFRAERGDGLALEYLLQKADPDGWRGIRWTAAAITDDYLPHFLSKSAIFGLSVTALPPADARLAELRVRVAGAAADALPAHYANDLDAAIERSERIKFNGVDAEFALAGKAEG